MKIVLIGPVPPYRGGIAHFTQALAEKLVLEGHDVLMISYRKQYPEWLYPGKSDKDYSQQKKIMNVAFLFSPLNYLDWRKTLQAIKSYQPDLVIYPWWITFWAPATSWLMSRLRKFCIPACVLVHNAIPHEARWIDKILTKYALKDARSFVTMTEKETERLRKVVHKTSKIETSAHPVYPQFPPSGLTKNEVRKKLGLPSDQPIALFFGFVRPYKGLGVLLDAVGILKRENVKMHLLVAGEFWQGETEYSRQIENLGISNMVTIRADYIPDSEAGLYFESADFFVAPYLDGTQSGSIKQAMGYQLPLAVTDVLTDPIIKENSLDLFIISPGNARALAKALQDAGILQTERTDCENTSQPSWQKLITSLTVIQNGRINTLG